MQRFYTDTVKSDLLEQRQMLFVSGPRQVGKTTLAHFITESGGHYFNWDNRQHRQWILDSVSNTIDSELMNQLGVSEPCYPQTVDTLYS